MIPEHEAALRTAVGARRYASGVVAGLGSLWALGTHGGPGADPAALVGWLSGAGFAAVLTGFVMAHWLDHHVVGQLRGLLK